MDPLPDDSIADRGGQTPPRSVLLSLDPDGVVRYVDDDWAALSAVEPATVEGERFTRVLVEEDATRFDATLASLAAQTTLACTLSGPTAADPPTPVNVTLKPEFDHEDTLSRVHCHLRPRPSRHGPVADLVGQHALPETLLDGLPVGILAETADRDVLAVNDELLSMFDVPDDWGSILGMDCRRLAATHSDAFDDPEAFLDGIQSRIDAGEPVLGEPLDLADGRTVERSYLPIELPDGDGHLWVYDDVTAQQRRETELATYERLFEVAPIGVFRTTTDGEVLAVNRQLARILGFDDTAELIDHYEDLSTDLYADPARRQTFIERLAEAEIVESFEYEARDGAGERRWLAMNARLLEETHDGARVITGFTWDVSERKARERDLQTYRDIVQRLDDPIMLQGLDGTFEVINDAVADFAGMPVDELLGTDEHAFMDRDAADRIDAMKARVRRTERAVEYDIEPTFDARGTHSFHTLRYPYYDETGSLAGTIAICRDVTDQTQRERQLALLGRVFRHNLRNAVTVIQGQAEALASGDATDRDQAIETILARTDALTDQADKERAITELVRGDVERGTYDLAEIVDAARERVEGDHPGATVQTDLPGPTPVIVCDRFEAAIRELLDNAVVHSDADAPTVTVSAGRDDGRVEIEIRDSGPGVPEVERKVLTGTAEETPLEHGAGVGLFLVRQLVHYSDGTVSVTDNDPHGSVIRIRIPSA